MPPLVLDCSVAVAWCFADEATPALDAVLDQVQAEGAIVPPLWTIEIGNVLLGAVRRNRLTRTAMHARLGLLDMLPIETDAEGTGRVWRSTVLALADTEGLTFYDAIYLELAIRHGATLATGDSALRRAATQRAVPVLPATDS